MGDIDAGAVADLLGAVFLVGGTWFTLVAALGLTTFPKLLARMHAATKPQTLGMALTMIGVALTLRIPSVVWMLVLVVAFQMITAPISGHMVSRAGYRTGSVPPDDLEVDEMREDMRATEVAIAIEEIGRRDFGQARLDAEG